MMLIISILALIGAVRFRKRASAGAIGETSAAHDPEKWVPVFGKDHAPAKGAAA